MLPDGALDPWSCLVVNSSQRETPKIEGVEVVSILIPPTPQGVSGTLPQRKVLYKIPNLSHIGLMDTSL